MATTVRIEGLSQLLKNLESLPAQLVSTKGGPVRSALFKATKMIRDRARELAPKDTGNLAKNIIAVRDRDPKANGANERYIIKIRKIKYTAARKAKAVRKANGKINYRASGDAYYGRFVEFGTEKMKAQPFMRPAFESLKEKALVVFKDSLTVDVEKIIRKLPK